MELQNTFQKITIVNETSSSGLGWIWNRKKSQPVMILMDIWFMKVLFPPTYEFINESVDGWTIRR